MILVTGATGNIGRPLVSDLHRRGALPVRALSREPARAGLPEGVEVFGGDLADPGSVVPALKGARALFLLSGHGAEADLLAAAREAGVGHVVLVSSLAVGTHPHLRAVAGHLAAERLLRDSGMAWTVLRPTQFASNALWWADSIRAEGVVRVPYPDVGLPAVHPADIAAVARVALTEPGHAGRVYEVTGPERVTPREQAAALSAVLGRDIGVVRTDPEGAHRELAALIGEDGAAGVLDLTGRDLTDDLVRVRDTVPRITGVPARTFREWAAGQRAAFC
ncbi:SDR family oxidoreductase [Streptomyces sp. NPDC003362]